MEQKTAKKRILTGVQPSGILHIGNYFGAISASVKLQEEADESFLFIADFHSLTVNPDPDALRERVKQVALDFLACGIDPAKTLFFRQSDVPEVCELSWILNCITGVGLLERAHSYKDKIAKGFSPNNGLFSYPVLMAADILLYKSTLVPVGKDQKQHLEITRDIAIRFNQMYGETLVVPDGYINTDVAVVPGLDGQKMSKSYNNTIEIFGNPKAIRKKSWVCPRTAKRWKNPKIPIPVTCSPFTNSSAQKHSRRKWRNGTVPETMGTVTQNRLSLTHTWTSLPPCASVGKNWKPIPDMWKAS